MDYTEAVELAKAGEERGFGYLYENTYKSKFYLALQYMKNEEAAKDVLQDSYIKAFSNLDKLQDPEAFPAWLGIIVANTAKNALVKKNPMLFSDVAVDGEDESFVYQIEDDTIENQPELSYTRKETQELVHELIDSLSEEQRICILMFHIEGASISEIAQTLNCSENTVKSRLNYGRKNLKGRAEELQKKGYKLYSIAPLPLLLLLLHSDQTVMALDGTIARAGKAMAGRIFPHIPALNITVTDTGTDTGAQRAVQQIAGQGVKTAVKKGFLHTIAGKAAAIAIGICVAGAAFYGVTRVLPKDTEPVTEMEVKPTEQASPTPEEKEAKPTEQAAPTPEQEEETPAVEKEVGEDEYPGLIAGNLTRDELAFVLANGPEEIPEQGFQEADYKNLIAALCCSSKAAGNYIADYGLDGDYRCQYSVKDLNRMFYSFTDYQLTEDNDYDTLYGGGDVVGEMIKLMPPTLSYEASAAITSAVYTDTEMKVYFDYQKISYEEGTANSKKVATLQPIADGMYRIIKIEPAAEDTPDQEPEAKEEPEANLGSIKQIYEGVLQSVRNQEAGFDFPSVSTLTGTYEYFLEDINGDGIPELIVGAIFVEDVFECHDIRVYSCEKTDSGYQLQIIGNDIPVLGIFIPQDGNGLYKRDFSRGTGVTRIYRITMESGALTVSSAPEMQFTMGDSSEKHSSIPIRRRSGWIYPIQRD